MESKDFGDGVQLAFDAIVEDRLALVCGAGLSMADPSNIPSARSVAASAKQKYDATYGTDADPLSDDIEEQAEFFYGQGKLSTTYLTVLVDFDTFSAPPNAGHFAVADFLLTKTAQIALSTNVDALIENAGDRLFGGVVAATRREDAAAFYPAKAPLLKIHGCWKSDHKQTVWAPSQLQSEPDQSRITACALWIEQQLLNRDLVVVGFFTDWDYLNALLKRCLGAVAPSNVIVVDPSPTDILKGKAPALFSIGGQISGGFYHVQHSGAEFLNELRHKWSVSYMRRTLTSGNQLLVDAGDKRASENNCKPPAADVDQLWAIRRDIEGLAPSDPCKNREPIDAASVGRVIVILRHAGAVLDGDCWSLNGQRIRVIKASGKALNDFERVYAGSTSPLSAPDITIASGARDFGLKSDIARSGRPSDVVRNRSTSFLTDEQAERELQI